MRYFPDKLKMTSVLKTFLRRNVLRNFAQGNKSLLLSCTTCRFMSSKAEDILNRTDRLHHLPDDCDTGKMYKSIMQRVPQPVVVVTSGYHEEGVWHKRGVTCTSFTSVSFSPPILSICLKIPSRMHDLLLRTRQFAVHILARHQVQYGMVFAQSLPDVDQFQNLPHYESLHGVPVMLGCCAVMECKTNAAHVVGDHHVWYGEILDAHMDDNVSHPVLYQKRQFRTVGEELFIQSFEDATLPFENWTHEAHLRMAWNYIREYGREAAEPLIKSGIQHYNEVNKDKIRTGYHETITMFYCFLMEHCLKSDNPPSPTFEIFLKRNGHLLDRSLMYQYYSNEKFNDPRSKTEFVLPDLQALPGM